MVAFRLDGSFTVIRHEWGMIPTDCSRLRIPKTRLIRVAAAGAAVVIAVASLSPQLPAIETGFGDKLDHLAAYSVLSLLVGLGWSERFVPSVIVGAAVGFGGLLELLQHFSPGRQANWADFMVNSLGALAGLALAMLVRKTVIAFTRTRPSSSHRIAPVVREESQRAETALQPRLWSVAGSGRAQACGGIDAFPVGCIRQPAVPETRATAQSPESRLPPGC
jgi:VanZ family protein